MDENKNHWMDYKPITEKEYSLLRVLLFKLQALLKKNKTKDRTEDRIGLDKILYDLHKRLFRNKERIYFRESGEKSCYEQGCFKTTDNLFLVSYVAGGEGIMCIECLSNIVRLNKYPIKSIEIYTPK